MKHKPTKALDPVKQETGTRQDASGHIKWQESFCMDYWVDLPNYIKLNNSPGFIPWSEQRSTNLYQSLAT